MQFASHPLGLSACRHVEKDSAIQHNGFKTVEGLGRHVQCRGIDPICPGVGRRLLGDDP